MNSRPILQKSVSMSALSTSVQVLTKNKPYYFKTNLGLMKILGEVSSATPGQRFEWTFPLSNKIILKKSKYRQKYHYSLKEHPKFTKVAKFGCEML